LEQGKAPGNDANREEHSTGQGVAEDVPNQIEGLVDLVDKTRPTTYGIAVVRHFAGSLYLKVTVRQIEVEATSVGRRIIGVASERRPMMRLCRSEFTLIKRVHSIGWRERLLCFEAKLSDE
jgi:hypothetical protein